MSIDRDTFRDAVSNWASGVAVVAVRDEGRPIAVTVTALLSLSLDPPRLLFTLSPNATVRPFMRPGAAVGISILSATQRRLASVFADPFPVGPDPFGPHDPPVISGAAAAFRCHVHEIMAGGDHQVVMADVQSVENSGAEPLIRHRGAYRELR